MAAEIPSISDEAAPIANINMTPFVDVVLVLLVIFMITVPTLMKDVLGIQLPKAESGESKSTSESFGVAITSQGQILLNGQIVDEKTLESAVRNSFEKDKNVQVLISADADSRHADLVRALDIVKSIGVTRFALQVRKPENN